jgi:SM-20-related protein
MDGPAIRINPKIDIGQAADAFKRDGFVQIDEIFEPAVAEHLLHLLETRIDWDLVFQGEDGRPSLFNQTQAKAAGNEELRRRLATMMTRAGAAYGFLYLTYPLITAYLSGRDSGHPIHRLTEFLNDEFVRLGVAISGQSEIVKADGQLTRYRPGDFIGLHDDTGDGERRAAYTLGLTREWRGDWGGQLLFHDEGGDVLRGFKPRFNAWTVFRTPQLHSVSQVANYAAKPRLTVTGWLRDDPPHDPR